jgi:hypothetical protein
MLGKRKESGIGPLVTRAASNCSHPRRGVPTPFTGMFSLEDLLKTEDCGNTFSQTIRDCIDLQRDSDTD